MSIRPYRLPTFIDASYVHHENIHKGNYLTITLFHDRVFGTYE